MREIILPTTREPVSQVPRASSLAERVYSQLRDDIFELRLLPGDRLTEGGVAARFDVSRTPAREALQRLQSDGLMQGYIRSGWQVVPIDFKRFDDLYEMRELIETFAVKKLCGGDNPDRERISAMLDKLDTIWSVPASERLMDGREVAALDEAFHQALVTAADNAELTSVFAGVTDRIRIVRRLDFVYGDCIQSAYDEHAALLRELRARRVREALALITTHISGSRADAQQLTLQRLHHVRTKSAPAASLYLPRRTLRTI
jgi:DNA-binding GntR family transcriptional regulator